MNGSRPGPLHAKTSRSQPVYKRIQSSIQQSIEEGKFKPGDLIWSERELARKHGVSLMTARNALSALEQQGFVERRHGSGTFVSIPKIDYNELLSTTELMGARGVSVRSRVLCAKAIEDQPEIAAHLGLPGNAPLVKLERVRQVKHEAIALEASYLAADKYGDLTARPLEAGSLFTTLENKYGVQIAYSDEEIDATRSDRRVAKLLGIEAGAPVLRIRQTIYSTAGLPVLYVLGLYRSETHQVHVRRTRR